MLVIVGSTDLIRHSIVQSREKTSSSTEKQIQEFSEPTNNMRVKVTSFAFSRTVLIKTGGISREQKAPSNRECPLVIELFPANKPKVL